MHCTAGQRRERLLPLKRVGALKTVLAGVGWDRSRLACKGAGRQLLLVARCSTLINVCPTQQAGWPELARRRSLHRAEVAR